MSGASAGDSCASVSPAWSLSDAAGSAPPPPSPATLKFEDEAVTGLAWASQPARIARLASNVQAATHSQAQQEGIRDMRWAFAKKGVPPNRECPATFLLRA